jgi:hypothetical protein
MFEIRLCGEQFSIFIPFKTFDVQNILYRGKEQATQGVHNIWAKSGKKGNELSARCK